VTPDVGSTWTGAEFPFPEEATMLAALSLSNDSRTTAGILLLTIVAVESAA
jgi:hypothetical protein